MAIQQNAEIGRYVVLASREYDGRMAGSERYQPARPGRPKKAKLEAVLDQVVNIGAAPSTLGDAIHVFSATNSFPLLNFVNEPCSHLSDFSVRTAVKVLPEVILETGEENSTLLKSLYLAAHI